MSQPLPPYDPFAEARLPFDSGRPLDLAQMLAEVQRAGFPAVSGQQSGDAVIFFEGDRLPIAPTPELQAVVDAHDGTKQARTATFELAEDAERLRLVNERARTDPAYAALADLALGKDR